LRRYHARAVCAERRLADLGYRALGVRAKPWNWCARLGLSPNGYRLEPRLAEISFGDWEGFTIAQLLRATPNALRRANMTNGILCHRVESYKIVSIA
jgi:broad specificity phosphatase PhoE